MRSFFLNYRNYLDTFRELKLIVSDLLRFYRQNWFNGPSYDFVNRPLKFPEVFTSTNLVPVKVIELPENTLLTISFYDFEG